MNSRLAYVITGIISLLIAVGTIFLMAGTHLKGPVVFGAVVIVAGSAFVSICSFLAAIFKHPLDGSPGSFLEFLVELFFWT